MSIERNMPDDLPRPDRASADLAGPARRKLHDHWKSYSFQGLLMTVVGILAILAPFAATLASTLFFGWLLVFGGIIGVIAAFRARHAPGFWSSLLLALLVAILGIVILYDPIAGSITLTWMLATYFLLSGVFNFSFARMMRASTGRFWLLVLSGVIDIFLAVFLILGLPGTAVWAVGLFIGISFITSGLALTFAALGARNDPPATIR